MSSYTHCGHCELSFAINVESKLPGLCQPCWDELVGEDLELEDLDDFDVEICSECETGYANYECPCCEQWFCSICRGECSCDPDDYDSELDDLDDN